MKKKILIVLGAFIAMTLFYNHVSAQGSKIVGTWKTIDDETGEAKSHVKIVKSPKNGMYYGKIIKLLKDPQDKKCDKCKGSLKNKPVLSLPFLTKMKEKGNVLKGGKILDPGNGKFYYCTMEIDKKDPNKLNVRGSLDSWGVAGRTQSWYRLK